LTTLFLSSIIETSQHRKSKMDHNTFIKVKTQNIEIIKKCLDTRVINLDGFTFWCGTTTNNLSFDTVMSKWSDILGCTAIGALPVLDKSGTDGHMWVSCTTGDEYSKEVEVKVCGVNQEDLALGARGGLYYSTNLDNISSKCSITSHFAGSFDREMSHDTMMSKKRDTYLVMFDRTENKLIDSYCMPARKVLSLLLERRSNYGKSITFKLSAFQQHGHKWHSVLWEPEGFAKWQKRITKNVNRFLKYD